MLQIVRDAFQVVFVPCEYEEEGAFYYHPTRAGIVMLDKTLREDEALQGRMIAALLAKRDARIKREGGHLAFKVLSSLTEITESPRGRVAGRTPAPSEGGKVVPFPGGRGAEAEAAHSVTHQQSKSKAVLPRPRPIRPVPKPARNSSNSPVWEEIPAEVYAT
jgi:hypothetical protein